MNGTELTEVRLGGRNYLRPGDPVQVAPRKKGGHDGYVGRVSRILDTPTGIEVEVLGGPTNKSGFRTFRLDRLSRTRKPPTR